MKRILSLLFVLAWAALCFAAYTGNSIPELDVTKPDGATESVSVLDDALREAKRALKNSVAVRTETTNYAATLSDSIILVNLSIANATVSLPTAIGCPGKIYIIKKVDSTAYTVTVDPSGSETIDAALTKVLSLQHQDVTIVSDNANWRIVEQYLGIPVDHGTLTGLADDDHPEYLRLAKVGQTLAENLSVADGKTIDGRDLSVDGARLDKLTIQFLATPVNKINWTAATTWTAVNISADTGADTAKAALLAVELRMYTSTATFASMTGLFRKNGSTETAILPRIISAARLGYSTGASACMVIVQCDPAEIFEVKLQTDYGSPDNISFKVDLIGYLI